MVGVTSGDFDLWFKGQLVVKAFVKRAARVAENAATGETLSSQPGQLVLASKEFKIELPTGSTSEACDVQEMVGQEAAAEVLAKLWTHRPEKDVNTEEY